LIAFQQLSDIRTDGCVGLVRDQLFALLDLTPHPYPQFRKGD